MHIYLCLRTEIIYCEKKLGAGFSWSWWLRRAVLGAGGSCCQPQVAKRAVAGLAPGAGSVPWMLRDAPSHLTTYGAALQETICSQRGFPWDRRGSWVLSSQEIG